MTPLKNIKKYYFPIKSQKIFVNKNFLSFVQTIRFCLDQNLPKSFILNQSLSWWLFIEIVLNAGSSALPSKRAGVCKTVSGLHFLSKYLLKVSYELITPLLRSTRLVRVFIISIRKNGYKEEWNVSEVFMIKIFVFKSFLF